MARSYANIVTSIWNNDDFCARSAGAQRTYFMLLTQTDISAAGTLAYTVKRWSLTLPKVERPSLARWLAELAEHRYVAIDDDTEELLVRKFIKWDNSYTNPRRTPSIESAVKAIRSPRLKSVMATELAKLGLPEWQTDSQLPVDNSSGSECAVDNPSRPSDSGENMPENRLSEWQTVRLTDSHRVVVKKGDYVGEPGTGNLERGPTASNDAEPSPFCSKHPTGTDGNCGPCGTARRSHDQWQANISLQLARARTATATATKECRECDDLGWRLSPDNLPTSRCNHRVSA